jgi:hypothetical protein
MPTGAMSGTPIRDEAQSRLANAWLPAAGCSRRRVIRLSDLFCCATAQQQLPFVANQIGSEGHAGFEVRVPRGARRFEASALNALPTDRAARCYATSRTASWQNARSYSWRPDEARRAALSCPFEQLVSADSLELALPHSRGHRVWIASHQADQLCQLVRVEIPLCSRPKQDDRAIERNGVRRDNRGQSRVGARHAHNVRATRPSFKRSRR